MALRRALAWSLLASLVGCGFALRSSQLDQRINSVAIDKAGIATTDLERDLRAAFTQAGVGPAADGEAADLVVKLLGERRNRRSISVTAQARAAEYELSRSVQYQVNRAGEVLIEPRWIDVERVFRVDRSNIVGSNEEERLIEQELKNDLVAQMIRSINQVLSQDG